LSDVGSCELEHAAYCCVTLKCRVGRCNLVVYDTGKTQRVVSDWS